MERLYIIVRADLDPGAIVAQTGHAVSAFAVVHPELHRDWHLNGKNLVVVSCPTEVELDRILVYAAEHGIEHAPFWEPDLHDSLTAVAAAEPIRKRVSSLPLALKPRRIAA